MVAQKKLNSFKTGDQLELFLLISNCVSKTTKNGKEYLDLTLRDQSTSINAKMWSNFESIKSNLNAGTVIKVLGTIDEFNNQLQIKIERIRIAEEKDGVDTTDFLPKSLRPQKEMESELLKRIEAIKNAYLKRLLEKIFFGVNFEKYKKAPAGKAWHHAYIGGLIEHTLEIVKICDLMSEIHPEINRDLLITGALLHDFGKIYELDYENGFEYTDKGRLIGHIVIVANVIEKECATISDFPEDLKEQLMHIVLSHQGKLEYASPVVPKTLEAIVLYHADELSAKTNAYKGAVLTELESDESWTRYLPLAETSVYIPKDVKNKKNFNETLF
jgi:3'-5' exoribonuclease